MEYGKWFFDGDNYAAYAIQQANQYVLFIVNLNYVTNTSQQNSLTFLFDEDLVGDIEIWNLNDELIDLEEERTFGWFKNVFGSQAL